MKIAATVGTIRGIRLGFGSGDNLPRSRYMRLVGDPDGRRGGGAQGNLATDAPEGFALYARADAVLFEDADEKIGVKGIGGLGDAKHDGMPLYRRVNVDLGMGSIAVLAVSKPESDSWFFLWG